ncbi:isocitrate lyase/phosphoenolpyruvate mutase family protein [Polyangium sp. y55x31]|uniref:isocitrate lyase/PEP mutase family protein n=1 Tax=Polyangium sp. y55x31 TaxID=3042688 RepID=UPI002482D170|nr:isocitrate lyase/phosphoenolpyruvate mutase family protein [Polyangium sp. y55x31]MDI1476341.1 isocitrate lyase/phosphoenolpyruvate mutase family protein [Polyangium sp. y55x31]
MTAAGRAERFRALHAEGHLLVLTNVWDAASARVVEAAGAEAIATSSAALAWAHGYADGEHLPLDVLVTAVREIAAVVSIPITVDFERGYADEPSAVVEAVARVADAGAVGVNLEDRSGPPDVLAHKIRACKREARLADVFINARIDVFIHGAAPESALGEALARGRAYADAGADGLFVPKVTAPAAIEALVRSTPLPLNVMAVPGLPSVPELKAHGVRRLSAGPGLALAALSAARRACVDLLEHGSYERLFDTDLSYRALNELFAR